MDEWQANNVILLNFHLLCNCFAHSNLQPSFRHEFGWTTETENWFMGLHGNSRTYIENVERYQQTARNIHVLYRTNIARGILDLHHVNPRSNKKQTNKQRSRNRVGQMGPGPKIWPNQIFRWRRNRPNLFFHLQCFYLSNLSKNHTIMELWPTQI